MNYHRVAYVKAKEWTEKLSAAEIDQIIEFYDIDAFTIEEKKATILSMKHEKLMLIASGINPLVPIEDPEWDSICKSYLPQEPIKVNHSPTFYQKRQAKRGFKIRNKAKHV